MTLSLQQLFRSVATGNNNCSGGWSCFADKVCYDDINACCYHHDACCINHNCCVEKKGYICLQFFPCLRLAVLIILTQSLVVLIIVNN